jgi:uncharacterized protein YbjT (DUF2867 family)
MFAVAGASGRVGAKTVEGLLKRGQKVRALVRSAEKGEALAHKHAELSVLDLLDTPALTKALTGVAGAFFMLPTPAPEKDWFAACDAMVHSFVEASRQAKLPAVVLLSSVGAQHPANTGPIVALHRAEKALAGVAKSVTFLRPALALEEWGPLLLDALESGTLPFSGHAHQAFPQIGAADVGAFAAQLLEEHAPGQRFVEVAGAQNWSVEEVASTLSSLLKTPIRPKELSVDDEVAALEHAGLPHARAALMAERVRGPRARPAALRPPGRGAPRHHAALRRPQDARLNPNARRRLSSPSWTTSGFSGRSPPPSSSASSSSSGSGRSAVTTRTAW